MLTIADKGGRGGKPNNNNGDHVNGGHGALDVNNGVFTAGFY